jgi:hypothetical protein
MEPLQTFHRVSASARQSHPIVSEARLDDVPDVSKIVPKSISIVVGGTPRRRGFGKGYR